MSQELQNILDLSTAVYGVVSSNGKHFLEQAKDELKEKSSDIEIVDFSYDRIGVDEASHIRFIFHERHWAGVRVCLIYASSVGLEAQNALLKTLEELPEHNHVILIVPHKKVLLDTIWSRIRLVEDRRVSEESIDVSGVFDGSVKKRVAFIDTLVKSMTKQSAAEKKTLVLDFIDQYEQYIAAHKIHPGNIRNAARARTYITNDTVPAKYVLEMLAVATEI